jgi:hypothetical protein
MTSCDNPPIGTDLNKYVVCPNGQPPNNLESKDPKNYNYYDASEWGVRLIPHSEEYNTANPIPTHIRVVWSDFEATAINNSFGITCNKYKVVNNPSGNESIVQPIYNGSINFNTINTLVFIGKNLKVGEKPWALTKCGLPSIVENFNFVTYYYDIPTTQDDDDDYIFIYTISDGTNNFTSYFIVPSKNTRTLHTFVGDNGVSFGNSLGSGSTDGAYNSNFGTTLAMKNFFIANYFSVDKKYNAKSYDSNATFKYTHDGTNTYNFSKIYNGEKHLMTTMCHMGDILYNWTQISFWENYFQMFECINSIVPILYTPGNHEYYDGCGEAYTFLYFNYLLPFNVPDTTITDIIDDSQNRAITNNLRTKILTWQYDTFTPLCIISYVHSKFDNLQDYPLTDQSKYQECDKYEPVELPTDNKIYFWHVNNDNGINDNKSIIFYGHVHATEIINYCNIFLTGGFGSGLNEGNPDVSKKNLGWCDLIQTSTDNVEIRVYNNTNNPMTDYSGSCTNNTVPNNTFQNNFLTLQNGDSPFFLAKTYEFNFSSSCCFSEGTKILCYKQLANSLICILREEYRLVQDLKVGDLVKSYKHGYRKISKVLNGFIKNNPNGNGDCMYKMKKTQDNGLIEDLVLTRNHAILVDKLTENEKKETENDEKIIIDDLLCLITGKSDKFEKVQNTNFYNYYHFSLDSDGDNDRRFGVWANGLLVELPSNNMMDNVLKTGILDF